MLEAQDIPFERHMTLLDFLHIESHGRDGAMCVSKKAASSVRKAILNSEFATLHHWSVRRIAITREAQLTDNTLNSDVLPAFWRPIIVTSISVALHETHTRQSSVATARRSIGRQLQCCCPMDGRRGERPRSCSAQAGAQQGQLACRATSSRGKEMKHTRTSAVTNHRGAERGRPWCRTSGGLLLADDALAVTL